MGGIARGKGGCPTTLSTLVVFAITLIKCFKYFYICVCFADEIIDIDNANKGEFMLCE